MKNREQRISEDKYIEKTLRTAFGYDEEQLLLEFEQARLQPDDPKLTPPADEFLKLLDKIKAEQKAKIPEEVQAGKRKIRRLKKVLKSLAMAAILGAMIMSMGVGASARRELTYWSHILGGNKNNQIWNNHGDAALVATEEEAYQAIEEELGIPVLRLGYTPTEIEFVEAEFILGQARLEFVYKTQKIQLYEALYDVEDSSGIFSDRATTKVIFNKWLKQEIIIEENVLENGIIEYGAKIKLDNARYSLGGIMEEAEFCKMVENLKIYE